MKNRAPFPQVAQTREDFHGTWGQAEGGRSEVLDVPWISSESSLNQRRETAPELLLKDLAPVRLWPHPSCGIMSPSDQENVPNWSLLLPPFQFPGISCLIGPKPGSRVCGHLSSFSFLLRIIEPEHTNVRLKRTEAGLGQSLCGLKYLLTRA